MPRPLPIAPILMPLLLSLQAVAFTPAGPPGAGAAPAGPASSAGPSAVSWVGFPTADPRDGRFLSLVDEPTGLGGQRVSLEVSVPTGRERWRLRIFDGDTGGACTAAAEPPCALPLLGHWDRGRTPLVVRLFSDPRRRGSEAEGDLIGTWRGAGQMPTADRRGRWRADPEMVDDGWWEAEIVVGPEARAESGGAFYHLLIELDPAGDGGTVSNFKVAADAPLAVLGGFGLEAAAGAPPNDFPVLYPGFRFGVPFDFAAAESTYDGTVDLHLDLPHRSERLSLLEGDLDHGTSEILAEPSGAALEACADGDDPDSWGLPPGAGANAVPEGARGPGEPADDHRFDALRRAPCVRYELIDPEGRTYRNEDPSGSLEWERFTISSDPGAGRTVADYAPGVAADGATFVQGPLPAGGWRIRIEGLDLGNSSFWRFDQPVCGEASGVPACPPRGEGCTPGFWKQRHHYDAWPPGLSPGTPFDAVFDTAPPGGSLAEALARGGGGLAALGRHAVAALLNAAAPEVGFDLSPEEVVALFEGAYPGDRRRYEAAKRRLEALNERRCPLH